MIRHHAKAAPLIHRSWIYNHLPQVPTWFTNRGHMDARARFHAKLGGAYRLEYLESCPYCGEHQFVHVANQERHGLPISVDLCMRCALVFTNPRLSQESLHELYKRDYRDIERGDIPDVHGFMYSLQASKAEMIWNMVTADSAALGKLRRVADIGCGEGGLLGWIADNNAGISVTGYELNIAAGEYGRARGLDIRTALFTRNAGPFDLVLLEQVLEHIADPSILIAEIAAAQPEGGLLYTGVPGLFSYPAHYEGNFCTYLDYAHLYHFCLYTLERLILPAGYQLVSGTEGVGAVFRRVSMPGTMTTPVVSSAQMQDFFEREESAFQSRGSHFWRNFRGYLFYVRELLRRYLERAAGNAE